MEVGIIMQQALNAALYILLAAILPAGVRLAITLYREVIPGIATWMKGHLSAKAYSQLQEFAKSAVLYVEQVAKSETGQAKYHLAESAVNSFLKQYKLNFSVEQVRVEIERAVKEELNYSSGHYPSVVVSPGPVVEEDGEKEEEGSSTPDA